MKTLALNKNSQLTKFKPEKIIKRIAGTEGLMKAFERVKDLDGFMLALDQHIAAKQEFVRGYKANFIKGGDMSKVTRSVTLPADEFLKTFSLTRMTVSRWAKLLDESYAWRWRQKEEAGFHKRLLDAAFNHRAQGTGENEWYTPKQYVEAARKVMGEIDLDPASSEIAQKTIQAKHFFTANDNGLTKEWRGRVWLNPPYAQPLIWDFIEKLIDELVSERTTEAILLTHNYSDTAWWHKAASIVEAICIPRGRLKFVDADGQECAPTQGQHFFYYGDNVQKFKEVFLEFGPIFGLI